MNINFQNNVLILENDIKLSFKFDIYKVLKFNNIIIVMLSVPVDTIYNENIYAFDKNGNEIWQIEKVIFFNKTTLNCPYVDMSLNNDSVVLMNWCDTNVVIDPLSGIVIEKYQTK